MSTQPHLKSLPGGVSGPATPDAENAQLGAAGSPDEREARWIELAKQGERGAWERLYQANYDKVLARLRYLCGDLAQAEELAQEAFVQAMINIDKFEGRSTFRSWLRSVALNVCRNHWRSQRSAAKAHAKLAVVHSVSEGATQQAPERDLVQRRRSEALYAALERIPENLREVFVLRDIEGLERDAVAEALGITPGNVSVRANRARERIRDELRRMGALGGGSNDG